MEENDLNNNANNNDPLPVIDEIPELTTLVLATKMQDDNEGAIYIMKNPSFPNYIKIGYADAVYLRLKQLNNKFNIIKRLYNLYSY